MGYERIKYYYDGLKTGADVFPIGENSDYNEVKRIIEQTGAKKDSVLIGLLRPNVYRLSERAALYGHTGKYSYDIYGNQAPGVSYVSRLSVGELKARVASGERHFWGVAITEIDTSKNDLSGVKFSNLDFSYCYFLNCNLKNSEFSGSVLRNTMFVDCDFTNADFLCADMRGAVLSNSKEKCDLFSPNYAGAVVDDDTTIPAFVDESNTGLIEYRDLNKSDAHSNMKFELEHHRAAQPYFMLKTRLHSDLVDSGAYDPVKFFGETYLVDVGAEITNAKTLIQHVSHDADVYPYIEKYIDWHQKFMDNV